ncbi:MAG: hypothetical protein ACOYM1_04775 [Methylovulum sp.]
MKRALLYNPILRTHTTTETPLKLMSLPFEAIKKSQSALSQYSLIELANGKTRYHPKALPSVIVSPKQAQVIPLAPEFITPQERSYQARL